jgi:hypothetical protein
MNTFGLLINSLFSILSFSDDISDHNYTFQIFGRTWTNVICINFNIFLVANIISILWRLVVIVQVVMFSIQFSISSLCLHCCE